MSFAAGERPPPKYDEACTRFDELLRQDTEAVDPRSRARLLTPGHRTERAIVLFHGLTNSPQQFLSLAERFTAQAMLSSSPVFRTTATWIA